MCPLGGESKCHLPDRKEAYLRTATVRRPHLCHHRSLSVPGRAWVSTSALLQLPWHASPAFLPQECRESTHSLPAVEIVMARCTSRSGTSKVRLASRERVFSRPNAITLSCKKRSPCRPPGGGAAAAATNTGVAGANCSRRDARV